MNEWLAKNERACGGVVVGLALVVRLWAAHGTFLNPDEALHFQIANHSSWTASYQASLTTAHPPLLIFVLHFWRALGSSEWLLRLPSVIAGTLFCCFLFRWMELVFGTVSAWIGLLFVCFLPPLIGLSAEVRQYALLLCFVGAALYLAEMALAAGSGGKMFAAYICAALAMLTHYSALFFVLVLGAYLALRLVEGTYTTTFKAVWFASQLFMLALVAHLCRTHLAALSAHGFSTMEGYLAHAIWHRREENLLRFVAAHSFGVFQFVFGQLAVGDLAGVMFLAGLGWVWRSRKSFAMVVLLALPFLLNCGAAVAGKYPYGGTRQSAFLVPFATAGVAVGIARLTKENYARALSSAVGVVLLSALFGSPHRPYMTRADQSTANMSRAMTFLSQNLAPGSVILVDYQTSLLLGHYLCGQQPISVDRPAAGFFTFRCAGLRVLSTAETWNFTAASFLKPNTESGLQGALGIEPGDSFWVVQAGWDIGLAGQLQDLPQFHDLRAQSFGRNIQIFRLSPPDSSSL